MFVDATLVAVQFYLKHLAKLKVVIKTFVESFLEVIIAVYVTLMLLCCSSVLCEAFAKGYYQAFAVKIGGFKKIIYTCRPTYLLNEIVF